MTKTYLLIPDAHAKAGDNLQRFAALRAWLHDRLQYQGRALEGLINIGDLWDFEALSLHDTDDPLWYHRNLQAEIDAGMEALDYQADILAKFAVSKPKHIFIEGNHENRFNKFMAKDNRLRTSPFPKTVAALVKYFRPSLKMEYVPFLKTRTVDGAAFSHYFVSGLMARAQSGERPAGTILKAQHMSCVCGHSHTLDYAERTRADGTKIHGLVSGCFVDPKAAFDFAGPARKLWWAGVHLLHFTGPGEFDVESVSLARLNA